MNRMIEYEQVEVDVLNNKIKRQLACMVTIRIWFHADCRLIDVLVKWCKNVADSVLDPSIQGIHVRENEIWELLNSCADINHLIWERGREIETNIEWAGMTGIIDRDNIKSMEKSSQQNGKRIRDQQADKNKHQSILDTCWKWRSCSISGNFRPLRAFPKTFSRTC